MDRNRLLELAGIKAKSYTVLNETPTVSNGDHVTLVDPKGHEPDKIGQVAEDRNGKYTVQWDLHNSNSYDISRLQPADQSKEFTLGDLVIKNSGGWERLGRVFSYLGGPYFEILWHDGRYSTEHENNIDRGK